MGLLSAIEWTNATWNPWVGCTKVSPACTHCYMFRDMRRYGRNPEVVQRTADGTFFLPLKKRRGGDYALPAGFKVFTCSWSDWFHQRADEWRDEAWAIIRQRPDLTFQVLTKRPERIADCLPPDWGEGYPNVWLGVTVENQEWADKRILPLLAAPAAKRFLSAEPLLGPIDLKRVAAPLQDSFDVLNGERIDGGSGCVCEAFPPIDWVIAGGETGPNSRPSDREWFRSLRDQCVAAGTPFFFKQWGDWAVTQESRPSSFGMKGRGARMLPVVMERIGKKAAGRLLDGREWGEFPPLVST